MEKYFKTITYNSKIPLKIEVENSLLIKQGIEVKATVDTKTGEVKFFIDKDDLSLLKY